MLKKFLYLALVIYTYGQAQNNSKPTIYLDENLNPINQLTYANKTLKRIYTKDIINRDSISIRILRKVYEFDSLNSMQLSQVQSLLKKYLNIQNFDKNIVIVYRDSLLGYSNFVSSIPQKRAHDAMDLNSEEKYLERRENYDSNQKKCLKFARKNNFTSIYGYSEKLNFTYIPEYYNNIKIPNALKSVFFQNVKRGSLILRPNGQYFFYSYLTKKQLIKMLDSDWSSYIKEYNSVKNNENKYSLEFIEDMHKEQRNDMRQLAMRQINLRNKGRSSNRDYSSRNRIRLKTPYNCFGYASY